MSGILVAQGQERFIKALAEYSEDQCINKLEYITGQNTNGQKRAMDSVIYGLAPASVGNVIEAGSSKRIIKKTAHNARKNDVVQFTSGSSVGVSIQILSCPDANTMILAATSEFSISIGDTFDIKRYVTPQYDEDGALVVVSTPGPTQFVYDGTDIEVEEDTAVPANNRPLPSKMFIQKDGISQPVNKDTGVPANTVAVPVEIVSASGTEINITAGDINIQTTSEGGSFDSMRIGSGVGLYAEITPNSELSVHDQDVLDELDSHRTYLATITTEIGEINTKTPQLGQAFAAASVPVVLTAAQLTALTPPAAITGFATEATLSALNVKIPAQGQALAAASIPVVIPALQLSAIAQAIQLPSTLGQKTMAASLAVTLASDQSVLSVTQAAPTVVETDQTQNVVDTATTTFTKPANAKNMVIFNNAGGSVANRARIGAAPSFAGNGTGALLGVGNSTALLPASTFLAIAEDATSAANITVIWFY